jgi:hypothetical protein
MSRDPDHGYRPVDDEDRRTLPALLNDGDVIVDPSLIAERRERRRQHEAAKRSRRAATTRLTRAVKSYRGSPAPDPEDFDAPPGPDRVIRLNELDQPCRDIARRAERAINAVLTSKVYAENSLDKAAGEMTLKRHEWEIALILRTITRLRGEHARFQAENPVSDRVGTLTSAVLDPQQRVLAQAQQSADSRVSAIEHYARQIKATDNARIDWENSTRLSGLNGNFLELAVSTAADDHVISELKDMANQAQAAARVYQDSLTMAALAAEVLAFPADTSG